MGEDHEGLETAMEGDGEGSEMYTEEEPFCKFSFPLQFRSIFGTVHTGFSPIWYRFCVRSPALTAFFAIACHGHWLGMEL